MSSGPETAGEALTRAREHARRALAEALLATRCLLDAAALGLSGRTAERTTALEPFAALLEQASRSLAGDAPPIAGPLVEAILDALDHEVRRWEERARDDAEARAVLRAFLGVREILWEFGLRRNGESAPPDRDSGRRSDHDGEGDPRPADAGPVQRRARPGRRVQRVRVQG